MLRVVKLDDDGSWRSASCALIPSFLFYQRWLLGNFFQHLPNFHENPSFGVSPKIVCIMRSSQRQGHFIKTHYELISGQSVGRLHYSHLVAKWANMSQLWWMGDASVWSYDFESGLSALSLYGTTVEVFTSYVFDMEGLKT